MPDPAKGLATQIKNIEKTYGRTMAEWARVVAKSGLAKHADVVRMLKEQHAVAHGAAHRIALTVRANPPADDPVADLYAGKKAALRPIHDVLIASLKRLGPFELVPKKGYLSMVRGKQFAMIKPAAKHIDVGLVLKGTRNTKRLESAATFNRLFTHRVRVRSPGDVDAELRAWLGAAFDGAAP